MDAIIKMVILLSGDPPITTYHHIFDLCGTEAMTAHIDDIISPAGDLIMAIWMAMCAVPREVISLKSKMADEYTGCPPY